MNWRLPEIIATSGLENLRLDLGVGVELLIDDGGDVAFGAEPRQKLANGPGTLPMEADHLTAELQVCDDLGGYLADGPSRAGVGRAPAHGCQVHVQSSLWPK